MNSFRAEFAKFAKRWVEHEHEGASPNAIHALVRKSYAWASDLSLWHSEGILDLGQAHPQDRLCDSAQSLLRP